MIIMSTRNDSNRAVQPLPPVICNPVKQKETGMIDMFTGIY